MPGRTPGGVDADEGLKPGGSGNPFVPGSIAQISLREWSAKNSAPVYCDGYDPPW